MRRAAFESLAVLLGVLGAFFIDAWWDESQEVEREAAYLAALAPEVVENLSSLDGHISLLTGELEKSVAFLSRSSVLPELPGDSLLFYLGRFGPVFPVPIQTAALADLLGSGGLSLVGASEVSRGIARYEGAIQELRGWEDQRRQFWEDQMYSFHLEHFDFRVARQGPDVDMKPDPLDARPFLGRTYANLMLSRHWHTNRVVTAASQLQMIAGELVTRLEASN